MTTGIEPVHLQETQLTEAGGVLARAFFDDPVSAFVLPDEEHRARALPALMGMSARHGFEVVTEREIPDGFRFWTMRRPALPR